MNITVKKLRQWALARPQQFVGFPNSSSNCPIALYLKDFFPRSIRCRVRHFYTEVVFPEGRKTFELSALGITLVDRFDKVFATSSSISRGDFLSFLDDFSDNTIILEG